MNKAFCMEKVRAMCAIFNRPPIVGLAMDAIYDQVADLPDGLMEFGLARLRDEASLPANLGRYLRLLLADYECSLPGRGARQARCPRCCKDVPGARTYWEKDGTPHTCGCVCGAGQGWDYRPTDAELLARGFLLSNPLPKRYVPRNLRNFIGPPRPGRLTTVLLSIGENS